MKRRHELISYQDFDSFLESNCNGIERNWEEPEVDPPDWFLTLGKTRFAVEATSITDLIDIGHTVVPSPAVKTALSDFVDELEDRANEAGILSGGYFVSLAPIPNLGEHKEELLSRFMQYIEDTQSVSSAEELNLDYIRNNYVSISKLNSDRNYIAEAIQFDAKWEGEAQVELTQCLNNSLETKKSKLEHIHEPKVLLILDAYNYSDIASWKDAIASIPSRDSFAAIARICPPDDVIIVWSSSRWVCP